MDFLLFDLDNTLYPPERELFSLIDVRINRFMTEQVGIPADHVDGMRRDYWQAYGVTLQGLIRHHGVDPEAYLHYVHDVNVGAQLFPDPELREMLAALPQLKAVFTTARPAMPSGCSPLWGSPTSSKASTTSGLPIGSCARS